TLVNRLVPEAERAVGRVNPVTGRGRHTSTSAVALPLDDGWIIDTPGVRSFGLAHIAPDDVVAGFPDLDEAVQECPPGCPHTEGAEGCALDAWLADGRLAPARVASLRRLLAGRAGDEEAVAGRAPPAPLPRRRVSRRRRRAWGCPGRTGRRAAGPPSCRPGAPPAPASRPGCPRPSR